MISFGWTKMKACLLLRTSVLPDENAEELNETEHNDHSMRHEEKVGPHLVARG